MAGLYFHIPFCKRICAYCDFFRSASLHLKEGVVSAMHDELREEHSFISDRDVRTIYFGGGTPSLLAPVEFQHFIDDADRYFSLSDVGEITIEANPDDIDAKYVAELRRTAVNRVSLGVQSFNDAELRFMNRRHNADEAVAAVKRLQDAGIENITIDLIFGVDGFGEDVLRQSLMQALELQVQHVSAYHLTIEPSTTFHRRLCRGEMREVDESRSEAEYALIESVLCGAGFEHYEVSNYAREGYRSRHNSSYWQGVQYLGIGPGAHSFNGEQRRWCSQRLEDYVLRREFQGEQLSLKDKYNELIMTSLRRVEGISLSDVERSFGEECRKRLVSRAARWIDTGDLSLDGDSLHIPTSRFLISDAVIESLFDE